eukprot:4658741-Pleurochrysis_carterae.AAC.2
MASRAVFGRNYQRLSPASIQLLNDKRSIVSLNLIALVVNNTMTYRRTVSVGALRAMNRVRESGSVDGGRCHIFIGKWVHIRAIMQLYVQEQDPQVKSSLHDSPGEYGMENKDDSSQASSPHIVPCTPIIIHHILIARHLTMVGDWDAASSNFVYMLQMNNAPTIASVSGCIGSASPSCILAALQSRNMRALSYAC